MSTHDDAQMWLRSRRLSDLTARDLLEAKRRGFSDPQIGTFVGIFVTISATGFQLPQYGRYLKLTMPITLKQHGLVHMRSKT